MRPGLMLPQALLFSKALESFIAAQVPRYVDLRIPTIIIAGDRDTMVSPQINARVLAATLPSAKLIMLKDVGHMPHHAAPEVVANAIDELVRRVASHCRTMDV
jgi:pimeloyl-ACP methyl ester carboxylesterase